MVWRHGAHVFAGWGYVLGCVLPLSMGGCADPETWPSSLAAGESLRVSLGPPCHSSMFSPMFIHHMPHPSSTPYPLPPPPSSTPSALNPLHPLPLHHPTRALPRVLLLLIWLWGASLALALNPSLVGYTAPTITTMLILGLIGRTSAYYRPEEPNCARACLMTTLLLHAAYCVAVWLLVLDAASPYGSAAFQLLLLWMLLVPAVALLTYFMPEYADIDVHALPPPLKWAVGAMLGVGFLFIGALGTLYSLPLALALLVTALLLLTLAAAALTWRVERYLPPRWRTAVGAAFGLVVLTGGSIGALSEGGAAYAGFSLCSLTLATSFFAMGLAALAPVSGESWRSYHMPTLVPSYAMVGRSLQRADNAVECFGLAWIIVMLWSAYSMLTLRPRVLGATAGAVAQAVALHAAVASLSAPMRELGSLTHVLTPHMLAAARSEAASMQLGAVVQLGQADPASQGSASASAEQQGNRMPLASLRGVGPISPSSVPTGRRRQGAFNLSDASITRETARVSEAMGRLQAAEAALARAEFGPIGLGGVRDWLDRAPGLALATTTAHHHLSPRP